MHTGLRTIQETSHARLKGMPKSMGSIRSHKETEKHIAPNGISASKRAPIEGGFMPTLLRRDTARRGGDSVDEHAISGRSKQAQARSWVSVAFYCAQRGSEALWGSSSLLQQP